MKKLLLSTLVFAMSFGVVQSQSVSFGNSSLTTFSTTQGVASAAQTFTVNGTSLTSAITVTAPTGYEVSSSSSSGYASTLNLKVDSGSLVPNTLLYLRISSSAVCGYDTGFIALSSTGATTRLHFVQGSISCPTPSVRCVNPSLTLFTTTKNLASAAQIITVSGTSLTGNVTVTAPTGYEISTSSSSGYASSLNLLDSAGMVRNKLVYVRMSSNATCSTYNGNITLSSAGASTYSLGVNGSVFCTSTVQFVSPLNKAFSTTQGIASTAEILTVNGVLLTGNMTVTAPTGYELRLASDSSGGYSSTATLSPIGGTVANALISVRLSSNAACGGADSGFITLSSPGATTRSLFVQGSVTCPTSSVSFVNNPTLANFSATSGVASAAQTFTVKGTLLTGPMKLAITSGYEISLNPDSLGYSTSITFKETGGTVANTVVYVRLGTSAPCGSVLAYLTLSSPGVLTQYLSTLGSFTCTVPTVQFLNNNVSYPFSATANNPSSDHTFTITGVLLTGNMTVTAPTGYELRLASDSGAAYTSTATLYPSSGTVAATGVFIRLSNNAACGADSGFITLSSAGATTQSSMLYGSVNCTKVSFANSSPLTGFSDSVGVASTAKTFVVNGTSLTGNVTVTAPTGYELSSSPDSLGYSTSVILVEHNAAVPNTTISIRLSKNAACGTVIGNVILSSPNAVGQTLTMSGTVLCPAGVHIPDSNFASLLIRGNVDTNHDGVIETSEAQAVTHLNISNSGIKSLNGIGAFTNLRYLNVSNNRLDSLNLSQNTSLDTLNCSNNHLVYLKVGSTVLVNARTEGASVGALVWLNVSNNNLHTLDVSGDGALNVLLANGNPSLSIICIGSAQASKTNAWTKDASAIYSTGCNIVTGTDDVPLTAAPKTLVGVFTPLGQPIDPKQATNGLFIYKYSDGSTRKMMIQE